MSAENNNVTNSRRKEQANKTESTLWSMLVNYRQTMLKYEQCYVASTKAELKAKLLAQAKNIKALRVDNALFNEVADHEIEVDNENTI